MKPQTELEPIKHNLLDMEWEMVALTDELLDYGERGEEPPEELLNAIAGGITATAAKRDRVAGFLRFVEAQADSIDEEIKRLKLRKQMVERGADRLKAYVLHVMTQTGQRILEGLNSTFKIVKNPPSVDAPDISVLPDDLVNLSISFTVTRVQYEQIKYDLPDNLVEIFEIKATADKKRIAAELKNGGAVPGAKLLQGERLAIK